MDTYTRTAEIPTTEKNKPTATVKPKVEVNSTSTNAIIDLYKHYKPSQDQAINGGLIIGAALLMSVLIWRLFT